jgi:hypothetical protein
MNADGSNVRRLTDQRSTDVPTGWSPDGSYILYYSDIGGNREIYRVTPDGNGLRQVTDSQGDDTNGLWRPCAGGDGKITTTMRVASGACTVTVVVPNASLRTGPGTNYGLQGTMARGAVAQAVGQMKASDRFIWWQLKDGGWVRADIVDAADMCEGLPEVTPEP